MRSSEVCTSSREEISPERTIPASSPAPRNIRSLSVTAPPRSTGSAAPDARRLRSLAAYSARIPATIWACPQGSSPVKHQAQKASAMSAVTAPEVQSGLEGVVAFATEIAEPDKEGGALRYRGVDIEDLVGAGPLRAGLGPARRRPLQAGPAAGRTARADRALGRPPRRRAVGAGDARARVGLRAADRHHRRGGPRQPRARLGDGALVRRAVGARSRPAAGAAVGDRPGPHDPRAFPDPLARRGQPRPRQGDRRLLGLGRRARHERLDVHRARRRLDRRRRRRGAVGARSARCRVRCTAARPRAC